MKKHKWLKISAIIISILTIWICASIYIEEINKQTSKNKFKQDLVESTKSYNFIDSIIAEPEVWSDPYLLLIKGKSSFDEMSNDERIFKLEEIRKVYLDKLLEYVYEQPNNKKMDDDSKRKYEISFNNTRTEITVETGKGKYIFDGNNSIILPDKTVYTYLPPVLERDYKLALIAEYLDNEIARRLIKNKYNNEQLIKYTVFDEAEIKFKVTELEVIQAWDYPYANDYTEIINRWNKEHKIKSQTSSNVSLNTSNTQTNIVETKPVIPNDYILNDSANKKLQYSDIEKLDINHLILARNEIFARYGYTFSDMDIAKFFNGKKWYQPTNNNSNIVLSEIEQANVNYIQKMEEILVSKKNGYE